MRHWLLAQSTHQPTSLPLGLPAPSEGRPHRVILTDGNAPTRAGGRHHPQHTYPEAATEAATASLAIEMRSAGPPSPHHERVTKSNAEATTAEEEEVDPLVNQQGCGRIYALLEDCLADTDRDWRKCQPQVQALKACHSKATGIKYDDGG